MATTTKRIRHAGHFWTAICDDDGMITVQRDDNAVGTIFRGWDFLGVAVEAAQRALEAQNEPEQRRQVHEAQREGVTPSIIVP